MNHTMYDNIAVKDVYRSMNYLFVENTVQCTSTFQCTQKFYKFEAKYIQS